jgi:hypothetical protein
VTPDVAPGLRVALRKSLIRTLEPSSQLGNMAVDCK